MFSVICWTNPRHSERTTSPELHILEPKHIRNGLIYLQMIEMFVKRILVITVSIKMYFKKYRKTIELKIRVFALVLVLFILL